MAAGIEWRTHSNEGRDNVFSRYTHSTTLFVLFFGSREISCTPRSCSRDELNPDCPMLSFHYHLRVSHGREAYPAPNGAGTKRSGRAQCPTASAVRVLRCSGIERELHACSRLSRPWHGRQSSLSKDQVYNEIDTLQRTPLKTQFTLPKFTAIPRNNVTVKAYDQN